MRISILFSVLTLLSFHVNAQLQSQELPFLKANISVAPDLRSSFAKDGRLILYVTKQNAKEPRQRSELLIAVNQKNWNPDLSYCLDPKNSGVAVSGIEKWAVKPSETIYFQVVYMQNPDDGQKNAAGNLYSEIVSVISRKDQVLSFTLNKKIPAGEIIDHKFVKSFSIKSKFLSDFSGYPRYLKASVLLPSGYFKNPNKSYPICYRAPGLNGRYTAVNGLFTNNNKFTDFWFSENSPQIIYVFLDSQGPYGDTYQVDSENNGPCGKALTEELIPEIEKGVKYDPKTKMRFLTGYSTGGWVSLGLQIFYPDFFDGTWSYSPDPVEFEHFGLINIYGDENVFYSRFGYLQPANRTIYGEPKHSMKDKIETENTSGRTGDYRTSGGQFGAYNAVFGPRGTDGLPTLMFDPVTGKIDHTIAIQWEKYDLKKILEKNWSTLGLKLQGKIWIWTGDMDALYSNVATWFFQKFIEKTENPKSDAKITFTPMAGHCQEWSDESVLKMIGEKVAGK